MTELFRKSTLSQRIFFGLLMAVFIGFSVQYSFKAQKSKSAVLRWSVQIQQMMKGDVDINEAFNYPNPPIMAIMLMPLANLAEYSPLAAALTWYYIKVALAILCMLWVFRLIETPEQPFPFWARVLTVALSLRPIVGDLSHGNINIFILFLVVSSLMAFSRGRDVLSGVLLALAIACKVTPALFVGYFLWKRAWRVLIGTAVGLSLFFLFVPALYLGWETNLRDLHSWFEKMIVPYLVGGVVTPEHNNQSLPGLIARMLTAAPSFSTYIGDIYAPLRWDNLADIGPVWAKRLVQTFMGLFALLVVWKCRAPIRMEGKSRAEARQGWRLAAEYALIVVGMLLFSERTWKHHCVTLLLPFAVMCYGMSTPSFGRGTKRLLMVTVTVVTLLISTTSTGILGETLKRTEDQAESTSVILGPAGLITATQSGIFTDSLAKLAQVYGAYTWGFFLLIAGLALQLRKDKRLVGQTLELPERVEKRKAG